MTLACHDRFEEAKSLYRKSIPVAQRVLGKCHDLTLRLRSTYALALRDDLAATLDDLREAVTTLEDTERIARRVLGSVHPLAVEVERDLGQGSSRAPRPRHAVWECLRPSSAKPGN